MGDTGSLASLLSGLFSGGLGISQLLSNNAGASAAMASPFESQYAGYQGNVSPEISTIQGQQSSATSGINGLSTLLQQLGGQVNQTLQSDSGNIAGIIGSTQGLNTNAGGVPSSVSGSGTSLSQQLSSLSSNYLSNPAIQSEYQTGLGAVNGGLAAEGLSGSGAQMTALENYGNTFAANEYNTEFSNLVSGSNAAFSQNLGATQEGAALNAQTFSQGLSQQSSLLSDVLGSGTLTNEANSAYGSDISSAGSLLSGNNSTMLNSSQGLLNSLEALSGATTGSPATAGTINSQQFGNTQQGVANLGSGATGVLSGLLGTGNSSGLLSSLQGLFGNNSSGLGSLASLFSGGSTFADDTISGLSDSLGSSTAGGFEDLLAGGADSGASEGLSALLGL